MQIQSSKFVATQVTTDYKGSAFTSSLTLGNPDFINGSGTCVIENGPHFRPINHKSLFSFLAGVALFHHLHAVSPNVAIGAEVAYQYGPGLPGGGVAMPSAVGRYTGKW